MTPEMLAVLTVVVLLVVAAAFAGARQDTANDEQGLPGELRGARVAYAEQTFRSRKRLLVARLDRAYEIGGELVLVEFKTRRSDVAYMADVIELSVQRVALQDERGVAVSKTAWVVTQNSVTGTRRAHRVALLGTAEVVALRNRYLQVEAGSGAPAKFARSVKQCTSCGHRPSCAAEPRQQTSISRS